MRRRKLEDVIRQVCRCLRHEPGIVRGTHTLAFAAEGDKAVAATVTTTGTDKAVVEDAAFEVFSADIEPRAMASAMTVEPARPPQSKKHELVRAQAWRGTLYALGLLPRRW
jgi:hypothetical protein